MLPLIICFSLRRSENVWENLDWYMRREKEHDVHAAVGAGLGSLHEPNFLCDCVQITYSSWCAKGDSRVKKKGSLYLASLIFYLPHL